METDHRHIACVEPLGGTHGAACVHLKVEFRAVFGVVSDTELGAVRSKAVLLGLRITVDGFDDHRDVGTVTGIVPEALDGFSSVIQNDIVVVLQSRRSQRNVSAGAVAKHGDFVGINAKGVVHFGGVHAEVANGGTRVLHATVGCVDQLVRALHLRACKWIPAEAVIDGCRNISHAGKPVGQFHNGAVFAGAEWRAVEVLRQEISGVEQQDEWAAGQGVTHGLVHVHELRHLHRG